MENILKTTARMGHFILRHRNEVLINVGTIALAGVVGGVLSYLKTRPRASGAPAEKKIPKRNRFNVGSHRQKRNMYKAPAMASENLVRH